MDRAMGESARLAARRAIEAVGAVAPESLRIGTIDLGPAGEHAIFTVLRRAERLDVSSRPMAGGSGSASLAPLVPFARLARLLPHARWPTHRVPGGSPRVLFVANAPIHVVLARQVVDALRSTDDFAAHLVVTAGPRPQGQGFATATVLGDRIDVAWLPRLAAHAAAVVRSARRWASAAAGERHSVAVRVLRDSLPRLAFLAAALDSDVRRTRPVLLAAFNESGHWGRLVPAVAHAHGLAAVDLPHAEAADPWGTAGVGYDRILVYGARSAAVMRQAGIEPDRIIEVGGLRYDPLVQAMAGGAGSPSAAGRRIVFASQPAGPGRAMTTDEKATILRITLAACEEAAPCELVIRHHPTETDPVVREVLAETTFPGGVTARIEADHDLHELLPGAWLLVTASSQSVYEAAIAGVPAITIHVAPGPESVPFAREGIAVGCTDEGSARAAVRALADDARREEAVEQARAALAPHLGQVDGHAAERVAQTIRRLAAP